MTRVRVNKESGCQVPLDILDPAGVAIDVDSLTEATLTLYDRQTYVLGDDPEDTVGIINTWEAVDILDDPAVTFDLNAAGGAQVGHVIWTMAPEDNVVRNPRRQIERHLALFTFSWEGGTSVQEVEIDVVNRRVTM